jgi:cytochrome c551
MLANKSGISFLVIVAVAFLVSCGNGQNADNAGAEGSDDGQGISDTAGSGAIDAETGPSENPLADISHGLRVWLNSGCTQCHRIGDDSGGERGPALTDVGDRYTREQLVQYIRNPQSVNPDSTMPPQELSDEDLEYLARYLSTLSSDTPGLR